MTGAVAGGTYSLHPLLDAKTPVVFEDSTAQFLLAQWELRQGSAPWPSDWPVEAERERRLDATGAATIIDWEDAAPGDGRYDLVILDYWAQVFEGTEVSPAAAARIAAVVAGQDAAVITALRAVFAVHQLWFNAAHRPARLDECVRRVETHLAPSWRALL